MSGSPTRIQRSFIGGFDFERLDRLASGNAGNASPEPEFSRAPGDGRAKEATMNGDVKVMDYKTDFPELGGAAPASAPTWGAKKTVPKIRSSNVSATLHLPPEERAAYQGGQRTFGSSLGAEQDKCNEIAAATKTSITLSEARDGTLTVMLSGARDAIEKAKGKIVVALQQQASREISVPKEHHRAIIG